VLDVTSGVDVLRIDRSGAMPAVRKAASITDLRRARRAFAPHVRWGLVCQLPSAGVTSAVSGVTGQNR
jgi:hypothetical protein